MRQHDKWVGIDLDGTLAFFDEWRGDEHVGEPIEPMIKLVKKMIYDGEDVRIFTARKPHPAIRRWCKEHLGKVLPITNVKTPGMKAFYDDRAVSVVRNKGVPFSEDSVKQTEHE